MDHAVTEEPVPGRRRRAGSTRCAGSGPPSAGGMAPVTVEVERRPFLLHRSEVAGQEPWCIHGAHRSSPPFARRSSLRIARSRTRSARSVIRRRRRGEREPLDGAPAGRLVHLDDVDRAAMSTSQPAWKPSSSAHARAATVGSVRAAVDERAVGPERRRAPTAAPPGRPVARATTATPPVGSSTCRYTPYADSPQWAVSVRRTVNGAVVAPTAATRARARSWSTTSWTSVMWPPMRPHITGSQRMRISSTATLAGGGDEQHDRPPGQRAHQSIQ